MHVWAGVDHEHIFNPLRRQYNPHVMIIDGQNKWKNKHEDIMQFSPFRKMMSAQYGDNPLCYLSQGL